MPHLVVAGITFPRLSSPTSILNRRRFCILELVIRGSEIECRYMMPDNSKFSLYDSFIQSAIKVRMSVSLRSVSLKPGVSTRITY